MSGGGGKAEENSELNESACVAVALFAAMWVYVLRRDWQSDARRQLRELGVRVHHAEAKEVVACLSELLRRIAMVRHGRVASASLTGEAWLAWLTTNDPAGFPWLERGRVLIDLPYAPPRDQARAEGIAPNDLLALIEAALPWLERTPSHASYVAAGKAWLLGARKSTMEWVSSHRTRYFHV